MIAPGTRIGRFVIERPLGAGGMGEVFEARDPELSRSVAIKVLRRRDDGVRLLREAQALARIAHPNVVAIYELGTHDDRGFVAMELVDGVTLDRHLAARTRPWREVLALYVQAGRGLAAVHAGGLIHRDVKPSNLLVDGTGRVRVGDFGLARHDDGDTPEAVGEVGAAGACEVTVAGGSESDVLEPEVSPGVLAAPLTVPGTVLGTPRYMAPEQRAGLRVTHHADQFAFCVALWEGLYGEHPFDGATRRSPPRGTRVPSWVARVLGRGLRQQPRERWPSMDAVLDVLERMPRRRRVAFVAAAGVVAAAGLALAAGAFASRSAAPVDCTQAGRAAIDAAWSAPRRAAITDATAAAELDRWLGRWREVRVDTCRATHARGEQSAAVLDRRVACLDGALIAFEALGDALGRSAPFAAARAAAAIERLPAPEACSAARVAGLAPPRADPGAAALERELAAAQVAVELRTPDARTLADAALAAARDRAEPALLARALLVHADAIAGTAAAAARTELDEAQAAAAAARDPAIEAAVLLRTLALATAGNLADRMDALIPVARAAVTRAGDPRPLRFQLAHAELGAAKRLGRVEDARAACDRMVTLAAPEDEPLAKAGCACTVALIARDNPGAATACAAQVAAARARYGDDHPRVAAALHEHVTALVRVEQFAEADTIVRGYLALAERLYGARSREAADVLQLVGVIEERRDDLVASRATLERALAIVEEVGGPDDPGRTGLLMELSTRAAGLGDLAAATRYADAGLAASERVVGADSPDLAVFLVFHAKAIGADPAQLERAIASWDRALAVAERTRGPQSFVVASILSSYAWFLANHGRPRPALALYERAVPIFDAIPEPLAAARTRSSIGEALLALHRTREARAAFLDARARFAAIGPSAADELAEVELLLRR